MSLSGERNTSQLRTGTQLTPSKGMAGRVSRRLGSGIASRPDGIGVHTGFRDPGGHPHQLHRLWALAGATRVTVLGAAPTAGCNVGPESPKPQHQTARPSSASPPAQPPHPQASAASPRPCTARPQLICFPSRFLCRQISCLPTKEVGNQTTSLPCLVFSS